MKKTLSLLRRQRVASSFLFAIVSLLVLSAESHGQEAPVLAWARQMGGTDSEAPTSIKTDASGNVYTAGYFVGTVDFDPGVPQSNRTSAGDYDAFVTKLDANGNFIWSLSFGATGSDFINTMVLDGAGNIYVTGGFASTVDFDPGPGVSSLTSAGAGDMYFAKFDPNGNLVWVKRVGGSGGDSGSSITITPAVELFVVGNFSGTVDFDPGAGVFNVAGGGNQVGFVSKFDSNGNLIWAKGFSGASFTLPNAVSIDASGNVISTGYFWGPNDFDPGAGIFTMGAVGVFGDPDIFVSKLDGNGNFIWAKQMGGNTEDFSLSVATDAAGNIYTAGWFFTTADFDPGAGAFTLAAGNSGFADIFVSKLDSNGNFVWAKQMGSQASDSDDRARDMILDAAGNILVTGTFNKVADFDPGPGVFNLSTPPGSDGGDAFISKLDADGNFVWAARMGGTLVNGSDIGEAIATSPVGDVYVTGQFRNEADFDVSACTFYLDALGSGDIFVQKLNMGVSSVPTFTSFAPTFGPVGTAVILTGTNFSTTPANNAVTFNGTPAVVSAGTPTTITTTVPAGATTGRIEITTSCTTVTLIQSFIVTTVALPTITSFTPASGPVATTVTITGTNFSATPTNNTVRFNGTTAVVTASTTTSITTSVPAGATTGKITVMVGANTATSATDFTVTTAPSLPTITSFTPASGAVGATVTITGTNFSTTPASNVVKFNGTTAVVTASTATSITTTVPAGATTGKITATIGANTATSATDFTVTVPGSIAITTQPQATTACAGNPAALSVVASGATGIGYQWQFATSLNGTYNNIANNSTYAGVTTHTLTVQTGGGAGQGFYRCQVTATDAPTVFSDKAALSVDTSPACGNTPPQMNIPSITTVIQGTVSVSLQALLSDDEDNLDLSTLRIASTPVSGAAATIDEGFNLQLDYTGVIFAGTDYLTLEVCDNVGACTTQEVSVEVAGDILAFNAVSANGDAKNEVLYLQYIDVLAPQNKVTIFNRWGDVVFETTDYDNDTRAFRGRNNSGEPLSSGTYYYKIEFKESSSVKTGFLSLRK